MCGINAFVTLKKQVIMKQSFWALALLMLAGCTTHEAVTRENLMHHHWVLTSIDQKAVPDKTTGQAQPDLEIGENLTVNGTTGCNRYRGQGVLDGSLFKVQQLSTTRRACRPPYSNIEQTLTSVLNSGAEITLTKDTLTLKNTQHMLVFTLRDWL